MGETPLGISLKVAHFRITSADVSFSDVRRTRVRTPADIYLSSLQASVSILYRRAGNVGGLANLIEHQMSPISPQDQFIHFILRHPTANIHMPFSENNIEVDLIVFDLSLALSMSSRNIWYNIIKLK